MDKQVTIVASICLSSIQVDQQSLDRDESLAPDGHSAAPTPNAGELQSFEPEESPAVGSKLAASRPFEHTQKIHPEELSPRDCPVATATSATVVLENPLPVDCWPTSTTSQMFPAETLMTEPDQSPVFDSPAADSHPTMPSNCENVWGCSKDDP